MTSRLPWHGAAAATCWTIHAGNHLIRESAYDLLWICNVAVLVLAAGCFFGRAGFVAVGVSWLAFGTPIWLLDLATGKGMIVTSPLVHVVAPVVGVLAVRRLGWPRGTWLASTVASVGLLALTRVVGSARTNVNLAFRIHDGWEERFGAHAPFLALIVAVGAAVFFGVECLFLRRATRAKAPM